MAKQKQHVFSARTTEEGLRALNEVKGRLKVSWDDLVIEAVSAHYNLDKAMMTPPRKEKSAKEGQTTEEHAPVETAEKKQPAKKQKGKRKGTKVQEAGQ